MHVRVVLAISIALSCSLPIAAQAADLPAVKTSERNAVPACATPGRLMAFLKSRNGDLDPRFAKIAIHYMRTGEELGVRWDVAFHQMALETSHLSFRRDGRRGGDVKPSQNNFAGLGATGNGQAGESFKDVETGVLAHLQHVLIYAGETVDNPVAERTRNVQKWGVLKTAHRKVKGPVTFAHVADHWAPGGEYANALAEHVRTFDSDFCRKPDPQPELLAEARGQEIKTAAAEPVADRVSGRDLARRAIEDAKSNGPAKRTGLGATALVKGIEPAPVVDSEKPASPAGPAVTLLNPSTADPAPVEEPAKDTAKVEKPKANDKRVADKKGATVQTASAAGQMTRAAPPAGAKCKVLTASYGGQKAMLIKAPADGGVSYTVLDVNEGNEKREADAYIAAYAKGGSVAGEFPSHTIAIDKAFELCPEG